MDSKSPFRVAIVGAGIGGLALSSALGFMQKDSPFIQIDIYEASSHIAEIGAGINLWKRGWEIMKNVGLEDALLKFIPCPPDDTSRLAFHVRKSDQQDGFHIKDVLIKGGGTKFHRADLQGALVNGLSGHLHLSHRIVSYDEIGDEIHLIFRDGSSATCDILIGMDGIKSTIRKCFLQKQGLLSSPSLNPVWDGTIAYRGLILADKLEKELPGHRALTMPVLYCGKSKHLVVYPVSQDRLINIVACATDPSKRNIVYDGPSTTIATQEEIMSTFKGWEEEVQALLKCIKEPTKWAILSLRPLGRYSSGRVILAGDAAHGMTPHQGAGAGQAIEDAYILANLITGAGGRRNLIPKISQVYNDICCPAGNEVLERSRKSGLLCELNAPGFEDIQEGDTGVPLQKLVKLFDEVEEHWRWTSGSAEIDKERAMTMLGCGIVENESR